MIKVEFYMTRTDGVNLVRTYSTDGYYITRDGEVYEEAIDPEDLGRVYTETDDLIPNWSPDTSDTESDDIDDIVVDDE